MYRERYKVGPVVKKLQQLLIVIVIVRHKYILQSTSLLCTTMQCNAMQPYCIRQVQDIVLYSSYKREKTKRNKTTEKTKKKEEKGKQKKRKTKKCRAQVVQYKYINMWVRVPYADIYASLVSRGTRDA